MSPPPDVPSRERQAADLLIGVFRRAGWHLETVPHELSGGLRPGFVVRRGAAAYAIEVKVAPEGRSDRLVPLWAQAWLQAVRTAPAKCPPLAIVAAPRIAPRVAQQVLDFAAEYAPDAAVGVMDFAGLHRFRGPELDALQSAPDAASKSLLPSAMHARSADLFSDLNQWMLKVILAPEIPGRFLSAPRGEYRNPPQLAKAANVSPMSAVRLIDQLRAGGFIDGSAGHLKLVRREDLFGRWRASAARRVKEVPMRLLLRGDPKMQLRQMLNDAEGCLALFAAADALGVGFVAGVPPYVYVPRIGPESLVAYKGVVPAAIGESPDFFVRQPVAPQSVFRGVVRPDDVPACDIIQVWLDVSSHPSRGEEQAELIRRRVFDRVLPWADRDG